jgi:hypothetical protein
VRRAQRLLAVCEESGRDGVTRPMASLLARTVSHMHIHSVNVKVLHSTSGDEQGCEFMRRQGSVLLTAMRREGESVRRLEAGVSNARLTETKASEGEEPTPPWKPRGSRCTKVQCQ